MVDHPLARCGAIIGDDRPVDRLERARGHEHRLVAGADQFLDMGTQPQAGKIGSFAALADHDHGGAVFLGGNRIGQIVLAQVDA